MKRIFLLVLALMLCASAAMADSPIDVAKEYHEALDGNWRCVYSERGSHYVDKEINIDASNTSGGGYYIVATGAGDAYLCTGAPGLPYTELGSISVSANGNTMVVYQSGELLVFARLAS